MQSYLKSTETIDSETESIKKKAESLTRGLQTDKEKAIALFYFVRDEIKFNPYSPGHQLEYNKASVILERGHGFCFQKAVLLVAFARSAGIPSRLHFVSVRNHRLSKEFLERMFNCDIAVHLYTEFYLDGKWVGATPAYDKQMCDDKGLITTDFDGVHDAKLPSRDKYNQPHIEYLEDYGHYADFPWEDITIKTLSFISQQGIDITEFTNQWKTNPDEY